MQWLPAWLQAYYVYLKARQHLFKASTSSEFWLKLPLLSGFSQAFIRCFISCRCIEQKINPNSAVNSVLSVLKNLWFNSTSFNPLQKPMSAEVILKSSAFYTVLSVLFWRLESRVQSNCCDGGIQLRSISVCSPLVSIETLTKPTECMGAGLPVVLLVSLSWVTPW